MSTRKVVINKCYGGFSLSRTAFLRLRELGNEHAKAEPDYGEMWSDGSGPRTGFYNGDKGHFCSEIPRDDPQLVQVVEELGEKANGNSASLRVISIPDDVKWAVEEYDGMEHVAEAHETWG